jgi:hypothetical protein
MGGIYGVSVESHTPHAPSPGRRPYLRQGFLECAGHAKDGAAGWTSALPARSSEQFQSLSSSQKGAHVT